MTVKAWLAVPLVAVAAARMSAQVGHRPSSSPYRDLQYNMEWTLFAGYFNAQKDRVGVAPQPGPMVGGRWDWRIGGPAYLVGRMAGASLKKRIIDPKKPIAERFVGTETVPLLFSDIDLGLNLTGFKTWHSFAPQVEAGFGTTADLRGKTDVGKFRFGSPLTVNFGAALKWVPGGKWQVRGDWSNYLYKISYPDDYFLRVGTEDPVLPANAPRSVWRKNVAFQIGLSYLYHR
jgi:hypothetical protein